MHGPAVDLVSGLRAPGGMKDQRMDFLSPHLALLIVIVIVAGLLLFVAACARHR
jgi:hypothetical protein